MYRLYAKGTAERAVQDALAEHYPDRSEAFFEDLAPLLTVEVKSAKSEFYKILKKERHLRKNRAEAYLKLLPSLSPDALRKLGKKTETIPRQRDRLESLEAAVRRLETGRRRDKDDFDRAIAGVLARLADLEDDREPQARPEDPESAVDG